MGKSKKNRINTNMGAQMPLEDQIMQGRVAKNKTGSSKFRLRAEEENFVDAKTTQRILKSAREQQAEVNPRVHFGPTPGEAMSAGLYDRKLQAGSDDDSETSDKNYNKEEVSEHDFYDDLKVNPEDEQALQMFQNKEGVKSLSLNELILQKIAEKQSEIQTQFSDNGSMKVDDLDPRVKEMYEGVRDVMKRFRSGKVPKAFKIIPKLRNWEQVLFITEPQSWSAAAMFEGTRIFSSGLAQHMAQRFYNLVLLPRIRDDLAEFNRLNTYLYRALKKALFKPAAFFKGIVLPLLEAGDCTLREAIIFGSVISASSIPVLHASACLLKICETEYSGANSIFIRILLEKRYALPYRVIDAAVFHFLKFENDRRELPILWHQALLTFVQRYKNDISSEQKSALFQLVRRKNHPKLTPEIRRELEAGKTRDSELGQKCEEEIEMEDDYEMDS